MSEWCVDSTSSFLNSAALSAVSSRDRTSESELCGSTFLATRVGVVGSDCASCGKKFAEGGEAISSVVPESLTSALSRPGRPNFEFGVPGGDPITSPIVASELSPWIPPEPSACSSHSVAVSNSKSTPGNPVSWAAGPVGTAGNAHWILAFLDFLDTLSEPSLRLLLRFSFFSDKRAHSSSSDARAASASLLKICSSFTCSFSRLTSISSDLSLSRSPPPDELAVTSESLAPEAFWVSISALREVMIFLISVALAPALRVAASASCNSTSAVASASSWYLSASLIAVQIVSSSSLM